MSIVQMMRENNAGIGREQTLTKKQSLSLSARREEYPGICAICQYAPTCIYPKDPERPVLLCEVFEAYTPLASRKIRGNGSPPTLTPVAEKKDLVKYVGLCVNCEKRETCIYPKPEGGIWHCEEYE